MLKIIPSIASSNQAFLGQTIKQLEDSKIDNIHIDIEDGNFTPNITFGIRTIKDLRKITNIPFSIHLMVNNPELYITDIAKIGVDSITVQVESCKYPRRIMNIIKDLGIKVGFALNPETNIDLLKYLIEDIDIILVMTSEPDGKGQLFIPEILKKVVLLSEIKEQDQEIWVDGGIDIEQLCYVSKAKANNLVIGRAIFKNKMIKYNIKKIREYLSKLI